MNLPVLLLLSLVLLYAYLILLFSIQSYHLEFSHHRKLYEALFFPKSCDVRLQFFQQRRTKMRWYKMNEANWYNYLYFYQINFLHTLSFYCLIFHIMHLLSPWYHLSCGSCVVSPVQILHGSISPAHRFCTLA